MSNENNAFKPNEVAKDVMDNAASGDGLNSEFREMQNNLTSDQFKDVYKEMQNLSGTEGFEDVLVTDNQITFNPNGESFKNADGTQNLTKWKYSSDSKDLFRQPDKENVLDGKLDGVKEQNEKDEAEKAKEAEEREANKEPEAELTPQEKVLGNYDTAASLRNQAREKGREDLIDTSKEVAEKILKGEDVHDQFEGENATNKRLLWKMAQAEMLKSVTPNTEIEVAKGSENTMITMMGMENGANVLLEQSNLGSPRDAYVYDDQGIAGTGIGGSTVMAEGKDAFITPQDKAAEANRKTWSDELRESFYDSMKGPNWDKDVENMREMKRILTEQPDSPEARALREKLKDNPKVHWVGKQES